MRASARNILATLVIALASAPSIAASPPFDVGVEVVTFFDSTRQYATSQPLQGNDSARPVRVFLWYPAVASHSPARMTIGSYAEGDWASQLAAVPGWARPAVARSEFASRLQEMSARRVTAAEGGRAYRVMTMATWLAPPAPGRFPLVLISSGVTARAYFHVWMAEHLARSGFLVAQIAALGPSRGAELAVDASGVQIGAADSRRVLEGLRTDPRMAPGRIGLVGWSVGGIVQLHLEEDLKSVAAFVSLDSGIGYDYAPRLLSKNEGWAQAPRIPYLHLSAGIKSGVRQDFGLLSSLGAIVQEMPPLRHADFTTIGLLAEVANPQVEPGPKATAHRTIMERTLVFLRQHLPAAR